MQSENKPFAPFGAIFAQLLAQKIQLKYAPFFFCGRYAYQEAKKVIETGQLALCLPIEQPFNHFSWPINGLRLILYDTGSMSSLGLSRLAYDLLNEGAKTVGVFSDQRRTTDIFTLKKELRYGKNSRK